jgi:hypothetical protein
MIAILFSFNGSSMMGGGSETFSYDVKYFTGSLILTFTMLWAFIVGILITTKAYRNDDYSFVTNQSASTYSNILFLLSACAFAGVTAFLSTHLFQLIAVFVLKDHSFMMQQLTVIEMLKGFSASFLYIFLIASIGYFAGMLIQFNRAFVFILPVVIFGLLILEGVVTGESTILVKTGIFFGDETSFVLFAVKVIGVSSLFYAAASFLLRQMEVKA